MHALEVKGKSTRGIRKVFVLIGIQEKAALERLITLRPSTSPSSKYVFARYEMQNNVVIFSLES